MSVRKNTVFRVLLVLLVVLVLVGLVALVANYVTAQNQSRVGGISKSSNPAVSISQPTGTPLPTVDWTSTFTPTLTGTPSPTATPTAEDTARFAIIGDFGDNNKAEGDVAAMIASWNPDFVVTAGDNNYPDGAASTIDGNIGKYYNPYIYPYLGKYGAGGSTNRFFPALGNHDWKTDSAKPYLDYFTLPSNERYYDFTEGPLELFILDSDPNEPDGVSKTSIQGEWLRSQLAASTAVWKVVVFHHAAYSSGLHGSTTYMRWPFKEWGADAVISGHDHTYERLMVDGIPYFVNGLGGASAYNFVNVLPESIVRYNRGPGAMLVDANATSITFQFFTRTNQLIDSFTVSRN